MWSLQYEGNPLKGSKIKGNLPLKPFFWQPRFYFTHHDFLCPLCSFIIIISDYVSGDLMYLCTS